MVNLVTVHIYYTTWLIIFDRHNYTHLSRADSCADCDVPDVLACNLD